MNTGSTASMSGTCVIGLDDRDRKLLKTIILVFAAILIHRFTGSRILTEATIAWAFTVLLSGQTVS